MVLFLFFITRYVHREYSLVFSNCNYVLFYQQFKLVRKGEKRIVKKRNINLCFYCIFQIPIKIWLNIYKEFLWMYPLTSAICIKMEERVGQHGQTMIQRVAITSTRHDTSYHTRFRTFSLSLAWFWCHLQRVTTRYRQFFKKVITMHFLYKFSGNAW